MDSIIEYKDVLKKFTYYKEEVIKELTEKGMYPDNSLIANRLNSIDMYLSLFKNHNVVIGDRFSVEDYNQAIKLIYNDLKILFELLEEYQMKEYYKQQNFIESYINELYLIADTYEKRSKYENSSTTLGKTLLFKNNGFTIDNDNSTTIINLDEIEVSDASTLYCIANINNVDAENLLFTFEDEDNNKYQTSPYNYSNEPLVMPGDRHIEEYYMKIQNDKKLETPFALKTGSAINNKNKYTILGGKNKMFINYYDLNRTSVEDMPSTFGEFITTDRCRINFYIVNGNSVSFKFNKKPISSNFPTDEYNVTNLDKIQYFFIECDKDFCFEIELDKGDIYAIKELGITNNNTLYYTGSNLINDFNILEESYKAPKKYKVNLNIYNDNDSKYDIDSIIIKELE